MLPEKKTPAALQPGLSRLIELPLQPFDQSRFIDIKNCAFLGTYSNRPSSQQVCERSFAVNRSELSDQLLFNGRWILVFGLPPTNQELPVVGQVPNQPATPMAHGFAEPESHEIAKASAQTICLVGHADIDDRCFIIPVLVKELL